MQATRPSKGKEIDNYQHLSSILIAYKPKVIKFSGPGSCKTAGHQPHPITQIKLQTIKCQNINLERRKHSKVNQPFKVSQRKGKMQLTITKKQFHPLKGKNKNKEGYLGLTGYQNSIVQHSQLLPNFPQSKNHITSSDFIQSFSCDFFSECNDASLIDEGQRRPLAFDDSRKTIQKNQRVGKQVPGMLSTAKKTKDEDQGNQESMYDFKRKKIFTDKNLNLTFDFGYTTKPKSRSRKSIFQQTTNLCDLSFSKNRSPCQRKRIFDPFASKKSKTTLKSHQQQLQQSKIPLKILQGWQTFSPCSQTDQKQAKQAIAATVELILQNPRFD